MQFIEITQTLLPAQFEKIKNFILKHGDQRTFRNFDCNNPHYSFGDFEAYLGADIGQGNINNDPAIADFNQLIIQHASSNILYYHILIVRKGDIQNRKCWLLPGMEEEKVYLTNPYEKDWTMLRKNCLNYLETIQDNLRN